MSGKKKVNSDTDTITDNVVMDEPIENEGESSIGTTTRLLDVMKKAIEQAESLGEITPEIEALIATVKELTPKINLQRAFLNTRLEDLKETVYELESSYEKLLKYNPQGIINIMHIHGQLMNAMADAISLDPDLTNHVKNVISKIEQHVKVETEIKFKEEPMNQEETNEQTEAGVTPKPAKSTAKEKAVLTVKVIFVAVVIVAAGFAVKRFIGDHTTIIINDK